MIEVGEVYKVRCGYTVFIGCNIFESGRSIEITDSNIDTLMSQKHKIESHINNNKTKVENKMMKRGRGRPPKLENK